VEFIITLFFFVIGFVFINLNPFKCRNIQAAFAVKDNLKFSTEIEKEETAN